jgi:hypothetical protein
MAFCGRPGSSKSDYGYHETHIATRENPDFSIQGEYGQNTPDASLGVQVVALGDGNLMIIF